MKNVLIAVSIIFLLCSCSRLSQKTASSHSSAEGSDSLSSEKNIEQDKSAAAEAAAELRNQLEKMTVTEIIDLYINENKIFDTDAGDYKLSCMFISHNEIQWSVNHTDFEYYPYLYIDDDENIRIELFYYVFPNYGLLGEYVSAGKDFIYITKDNLISRFINSITVADKIVKRASFKINKFMHEDLLFNIEFNTAVYSGVTSRAEKITEIRKGTQAEIIDMYFNNINDNHPVAVRIKNENLTGWISAGSVDFFQREKEGTVNGIWLHNAVRNAVNEYGQRAVKGKILDITIPLRNSPADNKSQLFVLRDNAPETSHQEAEVYIEDVSAYIDVINSIEAAWYKVCLQDGQESDPVTGWVFGSNLEINPVIDFSFNAGYR